MKTFKFFEKNDKVTVNQLQSITQLHRYHKRLLDRYVYRFNLYPGQTNYHAGGLIFRTVQDSINQGQLTSYSEVRSYYRISYRYLSNDVDVITDDEHENLVRMVEYITQPIPIGDLMGELINGIQELRDYPRVG